MGAVVKKLTWLKLKLKTSGPSEQMTKAYPSNLTWEQWELIAKLFPEAKTGGRPRTVCIYGVINAIHYVLCQGCTWRALPGDFPAWSRKPQG